jgi:bis(5'-adenosyl)-triphosphatase
MASSIHFGPLVIQSTQVFLRTKLSYGIVNLKPFLPGHVLVISKRIAPRISDLLPEEVTDMFSTVQRVGKALLRHYTDCDSLTVVIQDGPSAGQTVPVLNTLLKHVHVHVIPRRKSDLANNDDIYKKVHFRVIVAGIKAAG